MRVLVFARYGLLGASSRVRSYQFVTALSALGIDIEIEPLLDDDYLHRLYRGNRSSVWRIASSYLRRLGQVGRRTRDFDVIWIEKELFPWVPWAIERRVLGSTTRVVVDYDDAIFHRYDQHRSRVVRRMLGRKVDSLMSTAAVVTAGNGYLAARATSAGARRVEIIPSVVDTSRYASQRRVDMPGCRIGWIGSPATSHYLDVLRPAIVELRRRRPLELLLVGAQPGTLADVGATVVPWREETEVTAINAFDIGVMPLLGGPWELGKCGYKLIQYMACGRATVASAVGANMEIVADGQDGRIVHDTGEWVEALDQLAANPALRSVLGARARETVEERFSLRAVVPRLASALTMAANSR